MAKITEEIQKKGTEQARREKQLAKKIKDLISSGDINDLQADALKNWVEMLDDPDKQVRAFATKEVSKYLFATKRETTTLPVININCNFIKIKDNK